MASEKEKMDGKKRRKEKAEKEEMVSTRPTF